MQKTIEMDLMVLVMVFLKKFICRCVNDSGLRSITSALNWLFGIHNSKKIHYHANLNGLKHIGCLNSNQYGLIPLGAQARTQPPYGSFFD
jgi:hypothetical protein